MESATLFPFLPFSGETGLHAAVRGAQTEVIRLLLERGADPNARDKNGRTPVFNDLTGLAIEVLAQQNADFKTVDVHGSSPLWQKWDTCCVDRLVVAGVDPRTANKWGQTALHALLGGSIILRTQAAALRLISHEAPVRQADWRGNTPIHELVSSLYGEEAIAAAEETLVALLERGAEIGARNHRGQTALTLAKNEPEVQAMLRRHGATDSGPAPVIEGVVVGVYPVARRADVHMVEVIVEAPRSAFAVEELTQGPLQAPYLELFLDEAGAAPAGPINPASLPNQARLAFYFHGLDLHEPLMLRDKALVLPPPSALPARLRGLMKYRRPD